MSHPLADPIWNACHSSLKLDRLELGELSESEAGELRAHLESCAKCKPAIALVRAAKEEALPPLRVSANSEVHNVQIVPTVQSVQSVPSLSTPRLQLVGSAPPPNTRKPRWVRAGAIASGFAAAAALLLILRPGPAERSKGSTDFVLGMYVQHGESVRRASTNEQVQVGDALRFSMTAKSAGYAAVLSLDPAGHASIYFPLDGRAAQIQAGTDVPLPLSTRLDSTVGEEKIVGLWCSSPVELAPLRAGLEHNALSIPDGCVSSQQIFSKR